VRQRFWPLSLRSTVRGIQKCITYFRAKLNQSETLMGSLPASRVNVSRPFSRCGVEYVGPLLLREGKRRNARSHKPYVSLFVCFATKAVHLELVSDLTKPLLPLLSNSFRVGIDPRTCIRITGPSSWALIDKFKNYMTYIMINKSSSRLKIFYASWKFHGASSRLMHLILEAVIKSAKYHDSDRGQGSFDL